MFVVITQILENYGAHCEDGLFASGNAYWKFKSGETYLVEERSKNDCADTHRILDKTIDELYIVLDLIDRKAPLL